MVVTWHHYFAAVVVLLYSFHHLTSLTMPYSSVQEMVGSCKNSETQKNSFTEIESDSITSQRLQRKILGWHFFSCIVTWWSMEGSHFAETDKAGIRGAGGLEKLCCSFLLCDNM